MVFSSLLFFFLYLPLFLVLYFVLPKRAKNYVLLAFSLVFYAWGEPVYVFLMLGMTLSDYILGRFMNRFDQNPSKRKMCLILSIVIDLSCLAFFKYAGFLVGTINAICFFPEDCSSHRDQFLHFPDHELYNRSVPPRGKR